MFSPFLSVSHHALWYYTATDIPTVGSRGAHVLNSLPGTLTDSVLRFLFGIKGVRTRRLLSILFALPSSGGSTNG